VQSDNGYVGSLLQKDDELADMIKQRGVQPETDTSLWACLGRFVNYKDGSAIPHDTLAANAGLFFAAGYETTAHAITWAPFELAADTSIQVGGLELVGYFACFARFACFALSWSNGCAGSLAALSSSVAALPPDCLCIAWLSLLQQSTPVQSTAQHTIPQHTTVKRST